MVCRRTDHRSEGTGAGYPSRTRSGRKRRASFAGCCHATRVDERLRMQARQGAAIKTKEVLGETHIRAGNFRNTSEPRGSSTRRASVAAVSAGGKFSRRQYRKRKETIQGARLRKLP